LLSDATLHATQAVAWVVPDDGRWLATPRERLRVAVAAPGRNVGAPGPDEDTLDLWRAELRGPFAEQARLALEQLGAPAFEALLADWADLGDQDRQWLLRWASRETGVPAQSLSDLARVPPPRAPARPSGR
jgi:hypothetical protein